MHIYQSEGFPGTVLFFPVRERGGSGHFRAVAFPSGGRVPVRSRSRPAVAFPSVAFPSDVLALVPCNKCCYLQHFRSSHAMNVVIYSILGRSMQ